MYTLSYTYVHFLVLLSYLIAYCTIMDHLKKDLRICGLLSLQTDQEVECAKAEELSVSHC